MKAVPSEKRLIFGVDDTALVFIPRTLATELSALHAAIHTCATWGELRGELPPNRYAEALERLGADPPRDHLLNEDDIAGYGNSWPEHPLQAMDQWLPEHIRRRFGRLAPSTDNLRARRLPIERRAEILEAFRAAGYTCAPAQGLYDRACDYIRPRPRRRIDDETLARRYAARITFADYETQLNVAVEVCQLGRAGVELRLSSQLAHLISRAGAHGDVQALSEIGRASNWGVRWRVIRALRALGSADAASALLAASAGEWGPVDAAGSKFDIAQEALTALTQLTSPRAVDLITEIAASDSKHGAPARRVLGAWSASSRATGADAQRVRPGHDKPDTRR